MPTIIYVEYDGNEHIVDVDEEMTLMEGATLNMIPGVDGMCGGLCSCATCHVFLDDTWSDKINPMASDEKKMLEPVEGRTEQSRLGCQIAVTAGMDGLKVYLPEEQG